MAHRAPKDIFMHHVQALGAGDLDGLAADYADHSCLITAERVYRGRQEIRNFFAALLKALPTAEWGLNAEVYEGSALYIEWTAKSALHCVSDGVDTFVFKDGMIEMQTARCSLIVARLSAA